VGAGIILIAVRALAPHVELRIETVTITTMELASMILAIALFDSLIRVVISLLRVSRLVEKTFKMRAAKTSLANLGKNMIAALILVIAALIFPTIVIQLRLPAEIGKASFVFLIAAAFFAWNGVTSIKLPNLKENRLLRTRYLRGWL
jgi:hypothetical protein